MIQHPLPPVIAWLSSTPYGRHSEGRSAAQLHYASSRSSTSLKTACVLLTDHTCNNSPCNSYVIYHPI
ncbi:hypothetical protein BKA82DRAFT_1006857 [Pisolithus tinctorius]|uniref:Uncharacterized protein n=1 Tax=Pisolithus tinctorius Marx 270 TaxID=870435 RepID=A0A0C3KHZ7_PISTI|nr:hypothetical protein BKA82DRAFT_1006857 [Pisolithus tinctorius]KIN96240.1 hypothetical protein M404DRAFT_1006857 [Pisolithus tinctorius Marx 270]KIO09212.1 hypothetical protein M404DRAFT_996848 [Pisolithus tinctorius Marx 270]